MWVYIYIYACMYMDIYIYTQTSAYAATTNIDAYACIYLYIFIYTHTSTNAATTNIHAGMRTHPHTHARTCVHTHTQHTHANTTHAGFIYTQTHTHTHTHFIHHQSLDPQTQHTNLHASQPTNVHGTYLNEMPSAPQNLASMTQSYRHQPQQQQLQQQQQHSYPDQQLTLIDNGLATYKLRLARFTHCNTRCTTLRHTAHTDQQHTMTPWLQISSGMRVAVCSSMLQYVAVCCSMLQCVVHADRRWIGCTTAQVNVH